MRADNRRRQAIKGPSLNHTHEQAERVLTLSEIDSLYQNGEIDHTKAVTMALALSQKARGANYQAMVHAVVLAARRQ